LNPGDVVIAAFPGAHVTKVRPAVVLSTPEFHRQRPDVVLGLLTSRTGAPLCSTDCDIVDWAAAGLHVPSRFRLYIEMARQSVVHPVGKLAEADCRRVLECLARGLARI
jgi:mRNA interferase MazF